MMPPAKGSKPGARKRRVLLVRFVLPRAAKLTFELVGPAPSCESAARLRVRGHRGLNQVRITSRLGRRTLRRGVYRIVVHSQWRARPIAVRVQRNGRVVPVARALFPAALCGGGHSPARAGLAHVARAGPPNRGTEVVSTERPATPVAGGKNGGSEANGPSEESPVQRAGGVLGAGKLAAGGTPESSVGGIPTRWLAIVLGALLALALPAVLIAAATRDLKRGA